MISFACDNCGKQFTLKPDFAGRKTTCSGCKAPLVVPSAEETKVKSATAHAIVAPAVKPKIAFSCDKCGMKFSVPTECAGRKTTCPTCKESLMVPWPTATLAAPALGEIKGTQSRLAHAGIDGGVTLAGDFATAEALSLQNLIDGKANDGTRYIVESELARGGMGAVMRAVDCDIRREVAVKYLLDQSDAKKKLRFVEEAQITGQLEHPNIVPIHELGVDAENHIFFSMKMVKGRSMADVHKMLRDEPKVAQKEYSQGRLLNIFVNICNALAYAHSRGVVHRDLKPANIMVGDFGEVYVMDWGLAKVLNQGAAATATGPVMAMPVARMASVEPFEFFPNVPTATPVPPSATSVASGSDRVVTNRELDADLTQEGSVVGTPVYMPPEQASGKINDIDERSDIYSMGAILYEMLTLQPPISKEGGYWPILMRVNQGQIDLPQKKAPDRARAGAIPPELAAIAMKALARRKEDRYPSIELLRKDIERFMEGHSVSAKTDTIREMAVKLVKRNKGVSIATATAAAILLVVGVWSLVAILKANSRTRNAYDALIDEQKAKREQAKKSVPSFVRAAKLLIAEKQFDDAHAQVNAAINIDDAEPEARFVRAQLLLLRQDFQSARTDLEMCLKKQPKRDEAKALLELARDARRDDKATLLALAEAFSRQQAQTLAEQLARDAEKLMASKNELLQFYQVSIEAAWPGQGRNLGLDAKGNFFLTFQPGAKVTSLEPLRDIPLSYLNLSQAAFVEDLAPLKGMPLTSFVINAAKIRDLSPLKGMGLEFLNLNSCGKIDDLAPLKGMQIQQLHLNSCSELSDLWPLEGMPLTVLDLDNSSKVKDLSPLKGMPLTDLRINAAQVSDLTPLAGMKLPNLTFSGTSNLRDLSPLKGMPLEHLQFNGSSISDLSPLAGMKLRSFTVTNANELADLSALKGMPITSMHFGTCSKLSNLSSLSEMPLISFNLTTCGNVTELPPLKDTKLTTLTLNGTSLKNLESLKGLELTTFALNNTPVKDLEPLKGMPLVSLSVGGCPHVSDLSSLKGFKLKSLSLTNMKVMDLAPLQGMPLTLLSLNVCEDLDNLTGLKGVPLTSLGLQQTKVTDLSPLAGMKLNELNLQLTPVSDLTPLKNMPVKVLYLNGCKELHDLSPLKGMELANITFPPDVTKGSEAIRAMKSLQAIDGVGPVQFWKLWDAKMKAK